MNQQAASQATETRNRPAKKPSIEGTYRIVRRVRPDGSIQYPPEILGLHNFTHKHRNFNVRWIEDGKTFQVAVAATYKLTPKEYSETSLYHMNGNIKQEGTAYDNTGKTESASVTIRKNGNVEIVFPFEQPKYIFTKTGYRVESPIGTFFWKRVAQ